MNQLNLMEKESSYETPKESEMKKYTYGEALEILDKLKDFRRYVIPHNGLIKEILIINFDEDRLEHRIYPKSGEPIDTYKEVDILVIFSINNSNLTKSLSLDETLKLSKRLREALK